MKPEKLKTLSLFSGIGGIDIGLERTGRFEIIAQSEIDDHCCSILKANFPNVPNLGDITSIDFSKIESDYGKVDVVVGGFPCQDISKSGYMEGIQDGNRSGLWFKMSECISVLRPKYVIVENVATLRGTGLDTVLGSLAKIGYDAEWHCIKASDFGFPHSRERMFIVAYPSGERAQVCDQGDESKIEVFGWASEAYGSVRKFEWTAKPGVGRDINGLPPWVDDTTLEEVYPFKEDIKKRWAALKMLGNAVVPTIAEFIGLCVISHHESTILVETT